MKKRTLTSLFSMAALSAILLSACAAAAPSITEERAIYPEGEAVGAPVFAEEPAAGFAGQLDSGGGIVANDAVVAQASERLVEKTASLSIVVDDPEQRVKEIAAMAERLGGFVVSSNVYKTSVYEGLEVPGAYITVRVPSGLFLGALEEIRSGALDVPTDTQTNQDVTAEYTDLQSRLRNLENAEEMLRQIMEEARSTEDVLNAFNQLNYITEQIEVLKGQINYIEQSTALSAISVEIIANESMQPLKVGPWDITGVAKEAIEALVRALQGIAEALVWLALYVLPIVLIIGIPAWLIFRGLRGRLARRTASKRSK
ncbi:MAG: DUF4349 domain-containing protein [Chloroflexi bacterium]|nr:DUF4349 domain-containing protein [Chloroflexota bacterium]